MAVLVDKNSNIIVQGFTGSEGTFHAGQMIDYGTNVVGGVTPGKGGQKFDDKVPIFNSVQEAVDATGAKISIIFVPAKFFLGAAKETLVIKKKIKINTDKNLNSVFIFFPLAKFLIEIKKGLPLIWQPGCLKAKDPWLCVTGLLQLCYYR